MDLQTIQKCFLNDRVLFTRHAISEMDTEEYGKIHELEVEQTIQNGEIITEYPEDTPYPSVLIYGKTIINRPLHCVCAFNEGENTVIVVTVYQPDPAIWIDGKKRRM
jgi:hypothetical protein